MQRPSKQAQFFKLMQIAHDFKFSRFFELGIASWSQCSGKRAVLEKYADDVRRLDSKVLFRLLSAVCEQEALRCRNCSYGTVSNGRCSHCGRTSY